MFGRADAAGGQLLERLLLVLYAYGTNTGIRAVTARRSCTTCGAAT
jgi:hypothetical protein